MRLDQIAVGMILQTWHDSGAMGAQPIYCRVLKVGKVKVRVRSEYGDEKWAYPASFTKAMRPDDVDWITWR